MEAMSRLLVCPPEHFSIEYEINPWMRLSNKVHPGRARVQWQALMEELEKKAGATLERMEAVPGLPDLVFTANAGVVTGKLAFLSRFKHAERQREEPHFEKWFRTYGYQVHTLQEGLYFEGAGDLLGFPETWFGGYRQRSDVGAYSYLSKIAKRQIIPLELVDSRFYHLDTCFCPLSGGELLYYPPAFDTYAQTVIGNHVAEDRRLVVPEGEALRFACNAVCVGKHVVLPDTCPVSVRMLEASGYETHPLPLDEFMKAGGSAKCLTLALE